MTRPPSASEPPTRPETAIGLLLNQKSFQPEREPTALEPARQLSFCRGESRTSDGRQNRCPPPYYACIHRQVERIDSERFDLNHLSEWRSGKGPAGAMLAMNLRPGAVVSVRKDKSWLLSLRFCDLAGDLCCRPLPSLCWSCMAWRDAPRPSRLRLPRLLHGGAPPAFMLGCRLASPRPFSPGRSMRRPNKPAANTAMSRRRTCCNVWQNSQI